jgi:tetratricopeptide (TPR) repeat protein
MMGAKQVMVFPFTVPVDGEGQMRDAAQGVYARSLARTLAERLSVGPDVSATAATLTADGLDGRAQDHGWVVASHPWTLQEACAVGLPEGTEYLLHGAAELTDRVRLRLILVDQKEKRTALDHVVLRPRSELFPALEESAGAVAQALGLDLPAVHWPTEDVEAYVAYLRGRDLSAAHELGVRVIDPGRSFDPYLEAAQRDPAFADAQDRLLSLALDFALGGAGPVEAARAGCEKLLQLDPTAVKAHAALAEMDLAADRPEDAVERLLKALRIRPDWWPAFERLGTALLRLSRPAEAIPWFEKALLEKPEDAEALTGLGVALAETDRLEEAVAAWGRAQRAGEGGAHVHDNLARALHRLGRRGEARRHRAIARRLLGRGGVFGYLQDAWERLTGAACE